MGSCLSILAHALDAKQQPPASHPSAPNAAASGAPGTHGGAGPLSYAAAVAGGALHTLANQLEGQGGAAPAAAPGAAPPLAAGVKFSIENAYVFKMPDGDTISVDYIDSATSRKVTSRIRVMGVDCPETAQNFGPEACEIGRALVFRKNVTLHVHTTDRYGRIVADVITDQGVEFGKEMLRKGAAWHYKAYDKRQELAELEEQARAQRIGLWAYPRPVAPWDYRKRKRENQQQNSRPLQSLSSLPTPMGIIWSRNQPDIEQPSTQDAATRDHARAVPARRESNARPAPENTASTLPAKKRPKRGHEDSPPVKRPRTSGYSTKLAELPRARRVEHDQPSRASSSESPTVRRRKRTVAILMGYNGDGFFGMQHNPGVRTIEGEVMTALKRAGVVSDRDGAAVPKLMRAARTDKGVSAAMQVVSSKLACEVAGRIDPALPDLINAQLPPEVRVYGLLRATAGFNARTDCHRRRYEYILPLRLLGGNDAPAGDDPRVRRLTEILRMYVGTHCFSNFTEGLSSDNASATRYVIDITVGTPFLPAGSGVYYVAICIFGQSFVLHQIRKMVGLALFVYWGHIPPTAISVALSPHVRIPTATAPALGLLLDELYFDNYNARYRHQLPSPITIEAFVQEKFDFKLSKIYSVIAQKERLKRTMENWKRTAPSKLKYDLKIINEQHEKFVLSDVGVEERRRARIQSLYPILTSWSNFADPHGSPAERQTNELAVSVGEEFKRKFDRKPDFFVRAPGRVNIIGEHLDYNDLPIIGVALHKCTIIGGSAFDNDRIEIFNTNAQYPGGSIRPNGARLAENKPRGKNDKWLSYAAGGVHAVVGKLKFNRNREPSGGQLVVGGNLPLSQGLASSSSLVVAAALAAARINRSRLPRDELAAVAAEGERAGAGTRGGAGDHAVSMSATAGAACKVTFSPTFTTERVPLSDSCVFVLVSSGVDAHKGDGGAVQLMYNTRVAECRVGAAILARRLRVRMPRVVQTVGELLKLALRTEELEIKSMADLLRKSAEVMPPEETIGIAAVEQTLSIADSELNSRFLGYTDVKSFSIGKRMRHIMTESLRVERFEETMRAETPGGDLVAKVGLILNESHASLRDLFECSCVQADEVAKTCVSMGAEGARVVGAGWGGCVLSVVHAEKADAYLKAVDAVYGADSASRVIPSSGATLFVRSCTVSRLN